MQNGDVLYIPSSFLVDVLEVVGRTLGPISGVSGTAASVLTTKRLIDQEQ
jgi:hypothetical protein